MNNLLLDQREKIETGICSRIDSNITKIFLLLFDTINFILLLFQEVGTLAGVWASDGDSTLEFTLLMEGLEEDSEEVVLASNKFH